MYGENILMVFREVLKRAGKKVFNGMVLQLVMVNY
ncbi:MAG: hypothetical protein JWQ38_1541 [Flavipsychrobacter sp.]|nr:hypothetical protein [Flavipsychrobacter sp.]